MFGGIRQVYCHKWIQSENPKDKLHFLDINSAHSFVCSKYDFPYGKCTIMIGDQLKDVSIENYPLVSTSTGKQLCGLVKAKILPSQKCEPFFPTRIFTKDKKKSGVFQAMCTKCLEDRSHEPCQHQEHDREMEITTTVDTLNFGLNNGHCTLVQIFEIWVRK